MINAITYRRIKHKRQIRKTQELEAQFKAILEFWDKIRADGFEMEMLKSHASMESQKIRAKKKRGLRSEND